VRVPVAYKGHSFIAIADGAGLDIESEDLSNMKLARKLWDDIYATRIRLFPKYEEYDTTPYELITCLETMGLIEKQTEESN
jgi:hypothetical protein